jgi:hypothetical protein
LPKSRLQSNLIILSHPFNLISGCKPEDILVVLNPYKIPRIGAVAAFDARWPPLAINKDVQRIPAVQPAVASAIPAPDVRPM